MRTRTIAASTVATLRWSIDAQSSPIEGTMKPARPSVYTTTFNRGGVRLDVAADASKTPRRLTVAETQRGRHRNAAVP